MVDPDKDRNDVLMQGREEPDAQPGNNVLGQRNVERMDRKEDGGRLPYPGEIVGRKEPPFQATGLDALTPLLVHVQFPVTKEELIQAIGQAQVPLDKTRTASVASIIEKTALVRFQSSQEVEQAVARVWDQIFPHQDRGGRHWQRDNLSGRPVD